MGSRRKGSSVEFSLVSSKTITQGPTFDCNNAGQIGGRKEES
jgi:hypothetical protein